jgi:uncharacterized protein YjbI with pentapeptide repeats
MANNDHIAELKKGAVAWNAWRHGNPTRKLSVGGANLYRADLSGANLREVDLVQVNLVDAKLNAADLRESILIEADLRGADLSAADLSGACLVKADLSGGWERGEDLPGADLRGANLSRANLTGADLTRANLSWADLSGASLFEANLSRANLTGADLFQANLEGAAMVGTILSGANLTGCRIYGISAWNLKLDATKQQNLVITGDREPKITVDDIEVAQFIYLLLYNQKIRHAIDTITSKVVLILGRFTDERKAVLEALREKLRNRDLLPILFDFAVPASRDVTETIKVLAGLARFVIADITDATEVRVELHTIVPHFPTRPANPAARTSRVCKLAIFEEVSVGVAGVPVQ